MKNLELSRNFVDGLLKDNKQVSENSVEKNNYFREAIKLAYPNYRKVFKNDAKSFEEFATNIILRHNHKILNQSIDFQKNYFKNPQYIEKLIKDTIKAEEAKRNPNHTFTRDSFIDPSILEFQNLIDRRYQKFMKIDRKMISEKEKTIFDLFERFFEELISGVMLLEHEYLNDTFIIWRSLLETTTTLLILIENRQLIGRFDERRKLALMRLKIIKTPPGGLDAKSMETKTHLGIKNVAPFIAERFGWAGELIKTRDYSMATLLEIAKLNDLHAHYSFASIFVHEYLIRPGDLSLEVDFNKYLLTLYFKLYELVRIPLSHLFTNDLEDAKKLEEGIRAEVRNYSGRFNDFSLKIKNT